jgi:hypothetical protein
MVFANVKEKKPLEKLIHRYHSNIGMGESVRMKSGFS